MLTRRKTWGEERVFFEEAGRLRGIPAGWTDVTEPPVFVTLAAGRSHFRPDDLLRLADLVQGLRPHQASDTRSAPRSAHKAAAMSGKIRRTCKKKNAARSPTPNSTRKGTRNTLTDSKKRRGQ